MFELLSGQNSIIFFEIIAIIATCIGLIIRFFREPISQKSKIEYSITVVLLTIISIFVGIGMN